MKKILLLGILFGSVTFAQLPQIPLPPDIDNAIAGTVNFEGTVTTGVTDLVTSVAPSIMPIGWTLLGIFGVCALLQSLLQSTLRQMSLHHYNPMATVVAYVAILFRICVAALLLSLYMTPIPGVSFNFHQMFPYLAQALSNAITTDLLKEVLTDFNTINHFLPPVGMFSVMPAAITVLVVGFISLAQVAMTIITAGSFSIVGVLTLCGPLVIPFYVLPGHDKTFWRWFDNMLAYSMYVFVGAAFTFIFCHSYLDFFSNLHAFTVGQWLVSLPYLVIITVSFLWTMFKVPDITHVIFGGIGGVASGFAGAIQSLVVLGIGKALA